MATAKAKASPKPRPTQPTAGAKAKTTAKAKAKTTAKATAKTTAKAKAPTATPKATTPARPRRYFDDPEIGAAPKTSHPAFVALCAGTFFYTCDDEFAPFGSDAGSDTLHALQKWMARPRPGNGAAFLAALLAGWGLSLPDYAETRPEVVQRWLDEGEFEIAFTEVNQAIIATAFGQLKIVGAVEPEVRALALAANAREVISTASARQTNPAWTHHDAKVRADAKIRAALLAMA